MTGLDREGDRERDREKEKDNYSQRKNLDNDRNKLYNSSEKSERSWRTSTVMRWNSSLTEGSEVDSAVTIAELNSVLKEREFELHEKQVFYFIIYIFISFYFFIMYSFFFSMKSMYNSLL